jgi:PII-like signaling protein
MVDASGEPLQLETTRGSGARSLSPFRVILAMCQRHAEAFAAAVPEEGPYSRRPDMRGIEGEQVLLRLILSESRRHDYQPLFRKLLDVFRQEGMAGTTVLKGIAGFGHDRQVHTIDIEVASFGLPIILEVVDTQEHIDRVLPKVEALMEGGAIMMERAKVIRYTKS